MPLASYILSLCLHVGVILLIMFWPNSKPVINLEQPVMISLVDGAPGGNESQSPILGHQGAPSESDEIAPTPPAQRADTAATEREETRATPIQAPKEDLPQKKEEPKKPDMQPKSKPQSKPEPKTDAKEIAQKKDDKKKPEEKKEDKKKDEKPTEDKKQTARDKKDASKDDKKRPSNSVQDALDQARRRATSRADGDKGSSVERALSELRRNGGGNRGGGGGSGRGPGGGGINAVYLGQVMLAVRPNWGYASNSRTNLQCTIHVEVSTTGEVTACKITIPSGNAQYDSSCVNAIRRTSNAGDFPPPPRPEFQELDLVFTLNEFARIGR